MFGVPDQSANPMLDNTTAPSPMSGLNPLTQDGGPLGAPNFMQNPAATKMGLPSNMVATPLMQAIMANQGQPTPKVDPVLNSLAQQPGSMDTNTLGIGPNGLPPPAPTNNGAYSGPLSTLYSNPPQLTNQPQYGLPVTNYPQPTTQPFSAGPYSGGVNGGGIGQNPGWGRPLLPLQSQNPGFSSTASPSMMSGMMGRPSNGI